MNSAHIDEQIDMALQKREEARSYVRRRHALRLAVQMGLPAEIVREVKRQAINHRNAWVLLHKELKL